MVSINTIIQICKQGFSSVNNAYFSSVSKDNNLYNVHTACSNYI